MEPGLRALILLDESPTDISDEAVDYAARVFADCPTSEFHLLIVLPPTPPEFLEFGSIEEMRQQRATTAAHPRAYTEWLNTAVTLAHPAVSRARGILERAGIRADCIHEHYETSVHTRHVAQHALDVAQRHGCDTIVLHRGHLPWHQRWFHPEPIGEFIRKAVNMTVWIVNGPNCVSERP